jgi:hypothetical protein
MTTAGQQAIDTSWGGIVLATFALWGGLGLWTIIAVSGDYVRWLLSVAVLGIILAVGWGRSRSSTSSPTGDHVHAS